MATATGHRQSSSEQGARSGRAGLSRLVAGASYLGIPERTLARALATGCGVRAIAVPRHRSPEVLRTILAGACDPSATPASAASTRRQRRRSR